MEKNPDAYDYNKAQVSWKRKKQSGKASQILARSFLLSYSFTKDSVYRSYLTLSRESSRCQGH